MGKGAVMTKEKKPPVLITIRCADGSTDIVNIASTYGRQLFDQHFWREWVQCLADPYEAIVLGYIKDQTIGFGELVTLPKSYSLMLEGGNQSGGLGGILKERKLRDTIKALARKGSISVKRAHWRGSSRAMKFDGMMKFTIHPEWIGQRTAPQPPDEAQSDRHNTPITAAPYADHFAQHADHTGTTRRHVREDGRIDAIEPGTPPLRCGDPGPVKNLEDHDAGPKTAFPGQTSEPAHTPNLGAISTAPKSQTRTRPIIGWQRRWREAHALHFDGVMCASWTYDERNRLQAVARVWVRDSGKDDFGDFLAWCVERWAAVVAVSFKWMRDAPTVPSIAFMIRRKEDFAYEWRERQNDGQINARRLAAHRDAEPGPPVAMAPVRERVRPPTLQEQLRAAAARAVAQPARVVATNPNFKPAAKRPAWVPPPNVYER